MKMLFGLLALLSTGFFACQKDKACPPVETQFTLLQNATVLAAGNLSFATKANTGLVKIYRRDNGAYTLGLEKMNFNAGASVLIYLSTTLQVTPASLKISSARELTGDLYYPLPANTDFTRFHFLVIQTERSQETVATAELH